MTVCVVTPWFNNVDLAPDYFAAVKDADELVIIDNGSDPPLEFSDIRLDKNTGFCFASNVGLKAAAADVVVMLNNDVKGGSALWLWKLCDAIRNGKGKTLAGAQLRYDRHADVDGQPLPYLDGWCIAGLRTDLLALGGFDDTLDEPGYYSDNLLCLEARAQGYELIEVPTGLTHLENVTAKQRPDVAAASAKNRARYQQRARELLQTAAA